MTRGSFPHVGLNKERFYSRLPTKMKTNKQDVEILDDDHDDDDDDNNDNNNNTNNNSNHDSDIRIKWQKISCLNGVKFCVRK